MLSLLLLVVVVGWVVLTDDDNDDDNNVFLLILFLIYAPAIGVHFRTFSSRDQYGTWHVPDSLKRSRRLSSSHNTTYRLPC